MSLFLNGSRIEAQIRVNNLSDVVCFDDSRSKKCLVSVGGAGIWYAMKIVEWLEGGLMAIRIERSIVALMILGLFQTERVGAQPVVSGVAGTLSHGGSASVSGSGFGTKPTAAPYVWDNASGSDISQKWDFHYPFTNDAAFRLNYRAPSEISRANGAKGGVALPHTHVSKYIAGAHFNSAPVDTHSGYVVCAGKNGQEGQVYSYISYYRTIDPNWTYIYNDPDIWNNDHNFKEYNYAAGAGYMGDGPNIYFGGDPTGTNSTWTANYVEGMGAKVFSVPSFMTLYPAGTIYSSVVTKGVRQGWHKVELIMKHNSGDGFHRVYQDNLLVWEANLDDDNLASGFRSETVFGGYAREYGRTEAFKNNWRYYSDVYYDHSLARVVLANNADYSKATIVEPQILKSWSDRQISFDVNLGRLNEGQTVYLFVFDGANLRSSAGFATQAGGTAAPRIGAPQRLRIQ